MDEQQQQQQQQQPQRSIDLDNEQFKCSVCLDLLKEPVTLHCGHSYCQTCIEGCWDWRTKRGEYSCPQCRETFYPRPVLRKNNILVEVVEKLKKSSAQHVSACAAPSDFACDFCCSTEPNKATMSCLTCLASYCPTHLEPHYSISVLKTHHLVLATTPLKNKMCKKHNKLMEIYCQTDKRCICYLCTIDEHKCHQTSSPAVERAEEQKQLSVNQKKVQERIQEREKEVIELDKALKDFKISTQAVVESCDELVDEIISSIKTKSTFAKQLIKARETDAVAEAEELELQLKDEIAELKKRDADLEQLSHADDDVHFIQTFQSLSTSCESPHLPHGAVVLPQNSIQTVTDCVSELRDDIEKLLKDAWSEVSALVSTVDVVLPPVPKTRDQFLRYCCPLTLDVNSAYKRLSVSLGSRRVSPNCYQNHPSRSERFTDVWQVLCREGLSQRSYWEVSWSGGTWSVAMSYKDISRTYRSKFGQNNKSWSLECAPDGYTLRHDSHVQVVIGPQSSKIGVYLDHKGGVLSFYSITDTMTLLHTVHSTFTQPLHPGLGLLTTSSFSGYYAEVMMIW